MSDPVPERPAPARRPLRRRLRWPLLIGAPLVAVLVAAGVYLTGGRYQSTDDAYVNAGRVDVSANVAGRVVARPIYDNERVRAGQLLFRLDPAPLQTEVDQAEAALASARRGVVGSAALYRERSVELQAAQATLAYQARELARDRRLAASGVISAAQLDAQVHAYETARDQLAAAVQARANALAPLGPQPSAPPADNPAVRQAAAALARARLNLGYAEIRAPQDGVLAKVDQLQVGDYVNAAQTVFSLVPTRMWVEANFKEDQLTFMRPGQPATLKIDAYPDVVLKGRVQSLSPGTGSSFSVLPAENATGNWVKVVQRLPVRISIDAVPEGLPLHAGLSVTAKVDTSHRRTLFGFGLGR